MNVWGKIDFDVNMHLIKNALGNQGILKTNSKLNQ